MAALTSAGLADLVEAAARPEARPSAAQLLPITAAAEGLNRLERLLLSAAQGAPRNLASAAEALVRSGGKRVRPLLTLLAARAAAPGRRSRGRVALGALAARARPAVVEALREFGQRAGLAFQIADDLLDFEADANTLGKAVLADVMEGKPSLPLAIALKRLPILRDDMTKLLAAEEPEELRRARLRAFAVKLNRTGALGAARRIAERERDAALDALGPLPESPTRDLLAQVGQVLLSRSR